jgi:hypothetical protein
VRCSGEPSLSVVMMPATSGCGLSTTLKNRREKQLVAMLALNFLQLARATEVQAQQLVELSY